MRFLLEKVRMIDLREKNYNLVVNHVKEGGNVRANSVLARTT